MSDPEPGAIFHCCCTGVGQSQALRAMADRSIRTADDVARVTGAGSGCRSCWCDLEDLVEAVHAGRIAVRR